MHQQKLLLDYAAGPPKSLNNGEKLGCTSIRANAKSCIFYGPGTHSILKMFNMAKIKYCILVVSLFGFEDGTMVLIAPVPGHCLPFTFKKQ